ncbi:MAG TPA: aromatic acid exporter family protein, partial [Chondromyces sp.]|nr:aromatic acid exporter family protein [Chondromyces sp.]
AANSIKKAFIRFPASAIGAGFSVLFTFSLGDVPLTYALVSLSTIIACYKLKLHDGTLVATLTGVAMISTVHDYYLSSFFVRLGTTGIGLIVSSLVNLLVMPPNYSKTITNSIHTLFMKAGDILIKSGIEVFSDSLSDKELRQEFQRLNKDIERTEVFFHYQKAEWKFHRFNRKDAREFHYEYKKFNILRQITFHIGNLIYLPSSHFHLEQQKKEIIVSILQSLRATFHSKNFVISEEHHQNIRELTKWFSTHKSFMNTDEQRTDQQHYLLPETIVLYEVLSIHDLTEELHHIHCREMQHRQLLERS